MNTPSGNEPSLSWLILSIAIAALALWVMMFVMPRWFADPASSQTHLVPLATEVGALDPLAPNREV